MNEFKNWNLTKVTYDRTDALLEMYVDGDTSCRVFEPLNYCAKIIEEFWNPTVATRVYTRFEHPGTEEYNNVFKDSKGLALSENLLRRSLADFNNSFFPPAAVKLYRNEDWNRHYTDKRSFDVSIVFSTRPGGREWYLGTDGLVPKNKYDFVTICLHEIIHGLFFFTSSPSVRGGRAWHPLTDNRFLDFIAVETKHGDCNILSYRDGSKQLKDAISSNNLWFRTKEKRILKLYAPRKFRGHPQLVTWIQATTRTT